MELLMETAAEAKAGHWVACWGAEKYKKAIAAMKTYFERSLNTTKREEKVAQFANY